MGSQPKNGLCLVVLILMASLSGSSATFGWLADLFGVGPSKQYSPGLGGSLFGGLGGNRHRRPPGGAFGTAHGGGYIGGNGASLGGGGGGEYLGGGWAGSGNAGYNNYGNPGGFLGGLGLGGIGAQHHPLFRNHQGHQIHRYGQHGIGGP